MGCGSSKEVKQHLTVVDNVAISALKSSPTSFVTVNQKKFTEVYKVGKTLGDGSYGEVKLVIHKVTGQERAVKLFRKDLNNQASYVKVKTEIDILKKLSHPIIIKLYEYFEDEKRVYLVMEKCDGGELFEEIYKRKILTENLAGTICKQLFSAIAYLHENRIAHRDIKPENILLEEREDFFNIKIVDFGAAINFVPGSSMKEMIGSAFYLAPEVARYNYDEKCDMWSSGVILYILLCGNPPFGGDTNEKIIARIKKGAYSLEGPVWENVSEGAKDLINKLLCPANQRLTAHEALIHPWIQSQAVNSTPRSGLYMEAIENLKAFHSVNKLRDAVSIFISSQIISNHESKEIRELFKRIDVNGDGKLSKEEMLEGFNQVNGIDNNEEYIEKIMKEVDTDGNGFIDYNEFLKACISEQVMYSRENMKKAFDMFDLDGSGKISSTELQQIFSVGNLENAMWQDIVRQADKNSDGEIDFNEFYDFIKALSQTR